MSEPTDPAPKERYRRRRRDIALDATQTKRMEEGQGFRFRKAVRLEERIQISPDLVLVIEAGGGVAWSSPYQWELADVIRAADKCLIERRAAWRRWHGGIRRWKRHARLQAERTSESQHLGDPSSPPIT